MVARNPDYTQFWANVAEEYRALRRSWRLSGPLARTTCRLRQEARQPTTSGRFFTRPLRMSRLPCTLRAKVGRPIKPRYGRSSA